MKGKLKQRFLGALVLFALIVIIAPFFLQTHQVPKAHDNLSVAIPPAPERPQPTTVQIQNAEQNQLYPKGDRNEKSAQVTHVAEVTSADQPGDSQNTMANNPKVAVSNTQEPPQLTDDATDGQGANSSVS